MTIAKKFINNDIEYKDYDFEKRKQFRSEKMNKNVAAENLIELKKIFDAYDIKFTLLFGTALGAMRENDFIDHDTDTDTGIFEIDRSKLLQAIPEILESGFEIIRTKFPDDLVTFMRNDEYIDVGIFRLTKKNQKEYYTYQGHMIARYFLDSLDVVNFLGDTFNVPRNVKFYLTKTYGSDWHIPRRNEPALNTGSFNLYFRFKRSFLRTRMGNNIKKLIKKL